MKLLWICLPLLSSAFIPGSTVQTDPPNDVFDDTQCAVSNEVFEDGERFVIKVYYTWKGFWLAAGEIAFSSDPKVVNGRPVHHVQALGETYRSYEWFYKVRDHYETYMDRETMQPVLFKRDCDEGGYLQKDVYTFNQSARTVHTQDLLKTPAREGDYDVPPCVHDVLSSIYYARCVNVEGMEPGTKIPLSVFIDEEVFHIYFRYMGKETVRTRLGKFNTIKFKPLLLDNDYFDGGEEMTIWVTDDKNRLPVRIESPLTVGSVKADLKSFSGLRYPFEARH